MHLQGEKSSVYVAYAPLKYAKWSVALVIPREKLEENLYALNLLALVVGGLLVLATITATRQIKAFERTRAQAEQEALLNRIPSRAGSVVKSHHSADSGVFGFANHIANHSQ